MSYESQLESESTGEGLPSFQEVHEAYLEQGEAETIEAEDRDVSNETGDQQGEN